MFFYVKNRSFLSERALSPGPVCWDTFDLWTDCLEHLRELSTGLTVGGTWGMSSLSISLVTGNITYPIYRCIYIYTYIYMNGIYNL